MLQGNINEKDIERNFEGCEVFFTQRISRTFPREAARWHNHLLFILVDLGENFDQVPDLFLLDTAEQDPHHLPGLRFSSPSAF